MRTPDRTWQVTSECYQREREFRIRKVHILLQPLGQGGLRHWIGDSTGEDGGGVGGGKHKKETTMCTKQLQGGNT